MLAVSLILAVIAASEVVYWLDFMLIGHAVFLGGRYWWDIFFLGLT